MCVSRRVYVNLGWYDENIHYGIIKYANEHNWELINSIPSVPQDPEKMEFDGIISCFNERSYFNDYLADNPYPQVDLGQSYRSREIPRVIANDDEIGEMAAEFFLRRGFENFCCVHAVHVPHSDQRGRSFASRLRKAGKDCRQIYLELNERSLADALAFLKQELEDMSFPLAIFGTFDCNGAYAASACQEIGLKIPEDVSILGCGDLPLYAELAPVPLSSIHIDHRLWGYKAAEVLDSLLDYKPVDELTFISPQKIVERKSTRSWGISDPEIAKVLNFLQSNIYSVADVSDIVTHTCCSRRQLERGFKKYLNKTINETLTDFRIEEVKHRLGGDCCNVKAVATDLGFSSVEYLYRLFKKKTGMTTKEFRHRAGH